MEPRPRKTFDGYQYAVVTVDRAEGNGEVGTAWQDTYLIDLRHSIKDALTGLFGGPATWPKGRVCITVPERLPFNPDVEPKP